MTLAVLDRAVVASDAGRMTGEQERPDLEVPDRARRRSFTAGDELEVPGRPRCAGTGEKGAILRREGARTPVTSRTGFADISARFTSTPSGLPSLTATAALDDPRINMISI